MASQIESDNDTISAINVTPFVDIVLVLLIILMVTSRQIVRASLGVDLPKAASGGEIVETTLNIVITADETLILDGVSISKEELIKVVQDERAKSPKLQAVIAADKQVPYGKVIHIVDVIKTNGVTSFAFNVERISEPRE